MGAEVRDSYDAEIAYLEVSEEGGQAWIDTDYIPQGEDIDIYCNFLISDYSSSGSGLRIIHAQSSDIYAQVYSVRRQSSGNTQLALINGSKPGGVSTVTFTKGKQYELSLFGASRTYDFNGTVGELKEYEPALNTGRLILFCDLDIGFIYSKIYSFRLDKGGIPQLDLIPVRIGDEGFMYDRVSGKLFGNAGIGRFILGPDINS